MANNSKGTLEQQGQHAMIRKTVVRARVSEDVKREASDVLASMGLTLPDLFRMLLTRVARDKALPFEPLDPNEETVEAMQAVERGETEELTEGISGLVADLRAE